MDLQRLGRVKAIFAQAVEKTGAQRQAFLDKACRDDATLRSLVEEFLSAAERAGDFLSSPAPRTDPSPNKPRD